MRLVGRGNTRWGRGWATHGLFVLALGAGCQFGLEQAVDTDGDDGSDGTTGPGIGTTGPADASTGSDGTTAGPPGEAGGDSTTGGSEEGTGSDDGGGSSDDGTTTGDEPCVDAGDCPEGWECMDEACINPAEGMACDGQFDCDPLAPLCVDNQCWDGNDGDPCPTNVCAIGFFCNPDAVCQDGDEGDPCDAFTDCGLSAPHCAPDGACHDGSVGDSCSGSAQCQLAVFCGPDAVCQDGVEGDPCSAANQCADASPFCAPDGMCHDGSDGDPCTNAGQCVAPLLCNPSLFCQNGDEGDPCALGGKRLQQRGPVLHGGCDVPRRIDRRSVQHGCRVRPDAAVRTGCPVPGRPRGRSLCRRRQRLPSGARPVLRSG